MGQIYSKATDVRAWLGPGTETYLLAMQRLVSTDWPTEDQIGEQEATTFLEQSFVTDEFFAPVIDLLNHEYWSRIWIVQEYYLAANLVVQCGAVVVSALMLFRSCRIMFYVYVLYESEDDWKNNAPARLSYDCMGDLLASPGSSVIGIRSLHTRGFPGKDNAHGTVNLLGSLKGSKCTAPHDFVYALLSLDDFLLATSMQSVNSLLPSISKQTLKLTGFRFFTSA